MNKAVFLDRDGVIVSKPPAGMYVTCWEEMRFLDGVATAITELNHAGFHVLVVSNQRCVAKGLLSTPQLDDMHSRMCSSLQSAGAVIDAVYYCPHELQPSCTCRKPKPGMLLEAARVHAIDLSQSWMIGDSACDIEAGRRAGCKTVKLSGEGESLCSDADLSAPSLLEAVRQILAVR